MSDQTAFTTAYIHTDKLIDNIMRFKDLIQSSTKFMAVIKADAYGHGAVPLAKKMEASGEVDYFGVAQLSEALELRANDIQTKILVFNALRDEDIALAIENDIAFTVFTPDFAQKIVTVAHEMKKQATVHLKIDTGMARLGATTFQEALDVYQQLASSFVNIEGIYTHFADANELTGTEFTKEQFVIFEEILEDFEERGIYFEIAHSCNTGATINFPEYHLDMVRVGFGLYGYNPTLHPEKIELQPIQDIETTVTNIKDLPAGKSVGYDRTYYSEEEVRVATVAVGYADGVPISLSNRGAFTFSGEALPIIGKVCMDQIMLDSSEAPSLEVGDTVFYFGDPANGFPFLEDVALSASTSPYELLCRVGNRVRRFYK